MGMACSMIGEEEECIQDNVGKVRGKETIRKTKTWVDNIKMKLRETCWGGMDWIDLAQDRDQWRGSCERGYEYVDSIKCCEVLEQLLNWRLLKNCSVP